MPERKIYNRAPASNCQFCNRVTHSKTRGDICASCAREKGIYKRENAYKQRMRKLWAASCDDIRNWSDQLRLLKIKQNSELLDEIDIFRICHIYISVVCNENAYATFDAIKQANLMLNELWMLLNNEDYVGDRKPGRKRKVKID